MPQQQVQIEQLPTETAPWVYNLLTNPGIEAWQRGPGSFSAHGAPTADQWLIDLGPGSALTVGRDTTGADTDSRYCAACQYSHAAAGGAAARSSLQQTLEQAQQLRGRTVAFSVRVKCAKPGAVRVAIDDGALTAGAPHSGGGAYETLSAVARVSSSATVVRVRVLLEATALVHVDNAALIVGAVPQLYVPLHPEEDTARCLRYCFVLGGLAPGEVVATVFATSSTTAWGVVRFPVAMAIVPTLSVSSPSDWVLYRANGQAIPCTAIVMSELTRRAVRLDLTCAAPGLVGGNASLLAAGTSAARLVFEANPTAAALEEEPP